MYSLSASAPRERWMRANCASGRPTLVHLVPDGCGVALRRATPITVRRPSAATDRWGVGSRYGANGIIVEREIVGRRLAAGERLRGVLLPVCRGPGSATALALSMAPA